MLGPDGKVEPAIRLKKRPDFLRAATGRKAHGGLFTVQAFGPNKQGEGAPRVGFTVTKKVGNSVERNRIKRRLREVVRVTPNLGVHPTHDYVIIARRPVISASFAALAAGLRAALRKVHGPSASKARPTSNQPRTPATAPQSDFPQRCDR